MDQPSLQSRLLVAIKKNNAQTLAKEVAESLLIPELIAFTFHRQKEAAFRAGWVLELVEKDFPHAFEPHVFYFISRYPAQQSQSCRRHFTTIMMSLTSSARYQSIVNQIDMEPVLEASFEWLINPASAVAVQANCMNVLFNLRRGYDWVSGELHEQISFLMKTGGAAIQSRGRKVLYKLRRES